MLSLTSLKEQSPLINWLFTIVPFLVKGILIAALITLVAGRLFQLESVWSLGILIFIISTVIHKLAPNLTYGLEHGLGFAIALLIIQRK